MTVVSSKEFAIHQDKYFDLAQDEVVCIERGVNMFYINGSYNNHIQKRLQIEKILQKESKAVYASSMEVLKEFENIEDEL